jgi:hypothetical protein
VEANANLKPLLSLVEHAMRSELGIEHLRVDEEDLSVHFVVGGSHTDVRVFSRLTQDPTVLGISCMFDVKVPEARRSEVLEFILNRNIRFRFGTDLLQGETFIHYTYLFIPESGITPGEIAAFVSTGIASTDRAFPNIMAILFGGKTAKEIQQEEDDRRRKGSN